MSNQFYSSHSNDNPTTTASDGVYNDNEEGLLAQRRSSSSSSNVSSSSCCSSLPPLKKRQRHDATGTAAVLQSLRRQQLEQVAVAVEVSAAEQLASYQQDMAEILAASSRGSSISTIDSSLRREQQQGQQQELQQQELQQQEHQQADDHSWLSPPAAKRNPRVGDEYQATLPNCCPDGME
jgi:hypothetical protein